MKEITKRKKLLVICGPTATGKTSLGIKIAKNLGGEIVSADSRQVYIGMDIGTGKDLPKNSSFKNNNTKLGGYYLVEGVRVWGYDFVRPTQEFSVAQYSKIAGKILEDIWGRGKLPILVGGTGLYIKAIVDGIETTGVPKSSKLRLLLSDLSPKELYERLAQISPIKAASMNSSDRANPRRLVRAIEVADWETRKRRKAALKKKRLADEVLMVGLQLPMESLCKKIETRVKNRLKMGFEEEVKSLIAKRGFKNSQAMTSLGYQEWQNYLNGKISKKEAISLWTRGECKYAKRQMTWFKKDKRIQWFDPTKSDNIKQIEKTAERWYSSLDA